MTEQRRRNEAILEMLLCAALWSIAGIFIKLIPWNAFVIAGFRSFFAGLVMFAYMRLARIPFVLDRKSLLAGVALWLTFTCFVGTNKLTTAANAIVMQFTNPVFIIVLSAVFLHKRFDRADIAAVALTVVGIALFFFDQLTPGGLLGNIVGILAGLALGIFFMTLGDSGTAHRMSAILIAHVLTAAVAVPFAAVTKPALSALPVLYIVILGVFQLGIPYVLLGRASGYCPPLACSLLGAVEPLLNPVWVFFFDGEAPGPYALAGAAVVIVTITVWCVYSDRKARAACRTS